MKTSPPLPPLPPSGPPRGTKVSRLKLTQPRPPSPAFTKILTRSTNKAPASRGAGLAAGGGGGGQHAHAQTAGTVILEAHDAVGQSDQGVVFAQADVAP